MNRTNEIILKRIIEKDSNLSKTVADYYMSLKELNDPAKAVELLARHVAMMVEMINDFKNSPR